MEEKKSKQFILRTIEGSTHQYINTSMYNLGQTLVEVIVAIGVIMIVLIAILSLATTTIRIGTISR